MSRARNIKPGFFKNEVLVELPFAFRLLFVGLWTLADREGRLEDRPVRIGMELFPADSVDVDAGLQALHERDFILRYTVDGRRYIQVLAWDKHQRPHPHEARSVIPAPDQTVGPEDVTFNANACASPAPGLLEHADASAGSDHVTTRPGDVVTEAADAVTSSIHITTTSTNVGASRADSLIPDSLIAGKAKSKSLVRQAGRFREFWAAYPNKTARKLCEAKWQRRRLDRIADTILADIHERLASDSRWREGFIPNPATYLNQDRWTDEIHRPPARAGPSREPGKTAQVIAHFEDLKRGLAVGRNSDGIPEAALPGPGAPAGG
jgi:hypothetical protein